jgi:chaperonin GroEL
MNGKDALIAAILDNPNDEDARLVFADWLEEHSDPRAGCVRLATRLRASYGPLHADHSKSFWETIGRGIEPAWWAAEARRLAKEVDDKVGDGSKTAVLIALALTEATLFFPGWDGSNPAPLCQAADQPIGAIDRLLWRPQSREDLGRSLSTAALGDEGIAKALLSAIELAGRDGLIRIQPATAGSPEASIPRPPWDGVIRAQDATLGPLRDRIRVTAQRGLRFPLGDLEEGRELQQAAVLVSLRPLHAEEVRQALAACSKIPGLLCLCPTLANEGGELLLNAVRAGAPIIVCATQVGRWRDCFEDSAAATGARLIGLDEEGPVEFDPEWLGRAETVRVEGRQLVIDPLVPPSRRSEGWRWINHLRQRIEETPGEEQEWQCLRLGQFTGGVLTVEVGGESLLETEKLEALSCGALHSCRAVIAGGYVPGGGVAYLRAASACAEGPASQALRWALEEPARALLAGAELDIKSALASLRANETLGLDVVAGKLLPWRKEGPIEAAMGVRGVIECAIESAASRAV